MLGKLIPVRRVGGPKSLVPVVQDHYAPAEYRRVCLQGRHNLPAARGPHADARDGRGEGVSVDLDAPPPTERSAPPPDDVLKIEVSKAYMYIQAQNGT